jgi:hypothetical protein
MFVGHMQMAELAVLFEVFNCFQKVSIANPRGLKIEARNGFGNIVLNTEIVGSIGRKTGAETVSCDAYLVAGVFGDKVHPDGFENLVILCSSVKFDPA